MTPLTVTINILSAQQQVSLYETTEQFYTPAEVLNSIKLLFIEP